MPLPPGQLFNHLSSIVSLNHNSGLPNRIRYQKSKFKIIRKLFVTSCSSFALFFPQIFNELVILYYASLLQSTYQFASVVFTLALGNVLITKVTVSCLSPFQTKIKEFLMLRQNRKIRDLYQKTYLLMISWTGFVLLILFIFGFSLIYFGFSIDLGDSILFFMIITSLPYYITNLLFNLIRSLNLSNRMAIIPSIGAFMKMLLNLTINMTFYNSFGSAILWIGVARSLSEIIITTPLYVYMQLKRPFNQIFTSEWTMTIFKNLLQTLKLLILKGSIIYLERIPLELLTVVSLFLNQPELTIIQGCLSAYINLLLVIPFSICSAMSKHLKKAVQEGAEFKARNYALNGVLLCVISCILLTGMNLFFARFVSKIFAQNVQIEGTIIKLLENVNIAIWGEVSFNIISIMLRNLMKEEFILKSLVIVFYLIGLPLSIILCFVFQMKLEGLWFGYLMSLFLINFVLLRKLLNFDWDREFRNVYFSNKKGHVNEVLLEL